MLTLIILFGIFAIIFSIVVQYIATTPDKDIHIHYIERGDRESYISSCGKRIPFNNKNITNSIVSTTCPHCREKIAP